MFLGHYAMGLAAKKWAPKTSLGTLVAASIFLQLIGSLFLLLDLEHLRFSPGIIKLVPFDFYDFPLSHSLAMALAWAALWVLIYFMLGKNIGREAWVLGGLVASYWVLDLIVHRPDLPLVPADPSWGMPHKYGLSLWNFPFWTIVLEGALFAAGLWIYVQSTKALKPIGQVGLGVFALVLVIAYGVGLYCVSHALAWLSNSNLVSVMGILQLLFVAGAYWVDDHRKATVK